MGPALRSSQGARRALRMTPRNGSKPNNPQRPIKPGDRVRHYYAGGGVVERLVSSTTAHVRWDDRSSGIAYLKHMELEDNDAPRSGLGLTYTILLPGQER